ncbi:MAG: hypothetical protein JKX72_03825 [Robiginitomaculum sp.]|nr:hypothetical protein [Robiginitomaculum sp.]
MRPRQDFIDAFILQIEQKIRREERRQEFARAHLAFGGVEGNLINVNFGKGDKK